MIRRRRGRWFFMVALPVVLALGLVACGGDVKAPDEPDEAALPVGGDLPVAGEPPTEADPPVEVEIDLTGFAFVPRDVTILAGSTVIWTNRDAVRHTAETDDDSWDSGNLDQGESYRRTFSAPGTYEYHCKYHAAMVATITVE